MATYLPGVTDVYPGPAQWNPDFSFIDSMLRRRQGLYEQGFGEVSSQYRALKRNLTNPQNMQERDAFVKEAENKLRNLSAMDLSHPQNVQNATQVFKPFYTNMNVLGDMAYTAHMDQQEQIGEGFRLKDGGKEFSEDNIQYLRQQKQAFATDSADSWKQYYANRRFFTPYHNYSEEIAKSMEKFTPNNTNVIRKNGFYIYDTTDKSRREEDIKRYLDGTLSEKAKNQMRIEASVRLGNDPARLGQAYSAEAEKRIDVIDKGIQSISSYIKATKDPAMKKEYETLRDQYLAEKQDLAHKVDVINKGDLSYIKQNQAELAYSIYSNQKIKGLSRAYSNKDVITKIDFDDVKIMMYKENQEWLRLNAKFKHDEKMEALKAAKETATTVGVPVSLASYPGDVDERTLSKTKENIASAQSQMAGLNEELKDHMSQVNKKFERNKITDSDVEAFIRNDAATGHRDVWMRSYGERATALRVQLDSYNNELEIAHSAASRDLTPQEAARMKTLSDDVDKLGAITVETAPGVYKRISAGSLMYDIVKNNISPQYIPNPATGRADLYLTDKNGQVYRGADVESLYSRVKGTMMRNPKQAEAYSKYHEDVNSYYKGKNTAMRTAINFGDDSKKVKETKSYLEGILPKMGSLSGVLYDFADDRIYFDLKGTKDLPMNEDGQQEVLNVLTAQGLKAGYNPAAKRFYIEKSGIPGSDIFTSLNSIEKSLLKVGVDAGSRYASVPWHPAGEMDARGNKLPAFRYEKLIDPGGSQSYYLYVDGVEAPLGNKRYNDLYTLMIEAKVYAKNPAVLSAVVN